MRGKRCAVRWCRASIRIIPAHAGQTVHDAADGGVHADHPRACGANPVLYGLSSRTRGSSPRMRGKRVWCAVRAAGVRIIPAHAGQTSSPARAAASPADHPRACGANSTVRTMMRSVSGSSPRMRGKHPAGRDRRHRLRIIPAHAGQTAMGVQPRVAAADHPRACGANQTQGHSTNAVAGSSPRMRGKPWLWSTCCCSAGSGLRIIPAHAGQTGWLPHAGGLLTGSSPRMRGKPMPEFVYKGAFRIIPAHAGQTCWPARNPPSIADHPRACGANGYPPRPRWSVSGSSPRMRGKRASALMPYKRGRIIPAHAGQTPTGQTPRNTATDHPRACGANLQVVYPFHLGSGSSPRMRGKHGRKAHASKSDTLNNGSSPRMRGKRTMCADRA